MKNRLSSNSDPKTGVAKQISLIYLYRRYKTAFIHVFCSLCLILFFSACAINSPNQDSIKKADAHTKLGRSYLNNGQLNEAFIEFQKSIELNPGNKKSLFYLGYISARFKRYDEAISYYKSAVSIDPNYSDAINNLGVTFAEIELWDEAIQQFEAALKNPLYRTPAWAYSNMGFAYYMKGEYIKAENALGEALTRNPLLPRAMYILGLVYTELGNEKAAISEFKKAVGVFPLYMDAHWELANAYLKSGEKAKALKHFSVVAEKDENISRSRKATEFIEGLKY